MLSLFTCGRYKYTPPESDLASVTGADVMVKGEVSGDEVAELTLSDIEQGGIEASDQ